MTPTGADLGSAEQLELGVVVSALRAVSSSLELETLVDGLMRNVVQHAAADRAALCLVSDELRVRAEATVQQGAISVTHTDSAVAPERLPESVLDFVLRSSEKVLGEGGQIPPAFSADPYLRSARVRSLLCIPIVVRAKPIGVLYLENSRAFEPRGLAILDLIASQAAVSLENARLYAGILEAQLRMSQAERASRTGSFSWKPSTREVAWSEEMFRIYEMDDRSLDVMRQRVHPDDRAVFDGMVSDFERFAGKTVEYRLLLPNGSIKYLTLIASRIPGAESPTYVGTLRDVTESKRSEEALQRTQTALADMTRVASLGEMAAAIAHELNQPLSAIGLNASTCMRWLDAHDPYEARMAALRITRDAARAGAAVQRLRALFSKSEGLSTPVDLTDAIAEVLALLRSRISDMRVTLRLEMHPALARALGDRVQLQQVIMNLVTNALESMRDAPEDARELSIRTLVRHDGQLRCEVQDSGQGIREIDRERVFEPFYSTKPGGLGMGLSIARSILQNHDGLLGVRDNGEAAGSTFYFDVPAVPVDAGAPEGSEGRDG
jgi:signal transduction histidine kinase